MKKLFKEYALIAGGGTITLRADSPANFYAINGSDVTLTSGQTITIDSPAKGCEVTIFWTQKVTIGTGGSLTILGNNINRDVIDDMAFKAIYDGTSWVLLAYYAETLGGTQLDLDNIVSVNYANVTNDSVKRGFKTYADAISYINGQGTATTNNHWTVKMPSGYCNEAISLKAYVDIQGTAGTKIKSVTSNVAFVSDNVYDSVVYDCAIETAYVAGAKTANFVRCSFANITPVLAAGAGQVLLTDCTIKSADFSNTESVYDWSGNKFYATEGNILMSGLTHNVKDSEVVAYGANNISLPDSLINCFISIPAITTTRETSISGGKVVATTIAAGANLNLLNTDVGAADITMATDTNLTTNALKASGTIILSGTATKTNLSAAWNGGINTGKNSTAFGTDTVASGDDSVAMGNRSNATGTSSLAAGVYADATGHASIALGSQVTASGDKSITLGNNVKASSFAEIAMGAYATEEVPNSATAWNADDRLFVVGNGTSDIARADAMTIYKNGKIKFQNVLNLTPLKATPAVAEMGDMVSLADGTLWFYDGRDWGKITVVVPEH